MNIKIDKSNSIGLNKKPLIIAEISGNHNGKKRLFLKHIKVAAKNGADLVKIQTYEPQDITLKDVAKKFKLKKGIWKKKDLWNIYQKAHTPFKWHEDAFKLAKKLKITLFSTPFSTRAVDFLEKFKVPLYKISSFEITDHQLINYIAKKKEANNFINRNGVLKRNTIRNKNNKKTSFKNCYFILCVRISYKRSGV